VSGDDAPLAGARHGAPVLRGLEPAGLGGRFGQMIDRPPCDAPEDALLALAADMAANGENGEDNDLLPSGYTYLGQFIDHDLTFDPASVLQRDNDPSALTDFRTPALDLDSLYGSGPDVQPYLYDYDDALPPARRGVKLLVRRDETGRTVDLPRNGQDVAILGDARNDENLITAQLHLLFTQFHNILVDEVGEQQGLKGRALLAEVQHAVRRHYQWIVVHDFLPAFAGPGVAAYPRDNSLFEDKAYMPVEFSAGAFRCGHSMIRSSYRLNRDHGRRPLFSTEGPDLRGRRPLDDEVRIDWSLFFVEHRGELVGDRNRAMRIDDRLVAPLTDIPPEHKMLPRLNLLRGRALRLPSGQDVADALGFPALPPGQLRLDTVPEPARAALEKSTPLWFYLLREAAVQGDGGQHLGPVGGRIVAEVLLGLLEADSESYMNVKGGWAPDLGPVKGTFTMHDLITFVDQHEP
jgi:hypothetical protein